MKKKIQFVEMECDRILYKISKQNLEIKEFDDIWNNNGYIKKFTEKDHPSHTFKREKNNKDFYFFLHKCD